MSPRLSGSWPEGLACPDCSRPLAGGGTSAFECVTCARTWPRHGAYPELLPALRPVGDWPQRQLTTTRYYRELLADPVAAASAFAADFDSLRPGLASLEGRLLDVGGGNGLLRGYLPAVTEYVSLDSDPAWLETSWDALAHWHPCLHLPLQFVRGMAEHLPFVDGSFDCAAAVFSLNHCIAPQQVLRQMSRVVRPGGVLLLVLEDVEPGWRDALLGPYRDWRGWSGARVVGEKARALWRGWPMEEDHVAITERDVRSWLGNGFTIRRRVWCGSYLALELR